MEMALSNNFEAGEQKGGNAGCASCSGDATKYKILAVSLSKPHLTLSVEGIGSKKCVPRRWESETIK